MNGEPQGLGSDSSEGHGQCTECLGSTVGGMVGRREASAGKLGFIKLYLKDCGHLL